MSGYVATAQTDVAASPERVWAALTEPEQIAAYMQGSRVESTWQVGSPITWNGEYDGRPYQDKGEVLTYDEPHVLSVTHYSPMMGQPVRPPVSPVGTVAPARGGARFVRERCSPGGSGTVPGDEAGRTKVRPRFEIGCHAPPERRYACLSGSVRLGRRRRRSAARSDRAVGSSRGRSASSRTGRRSSP